MAENSTFERVRAIIVDQLGVDAEDVTMEANFRDDLEADSLDLVFFIVCSAWGSVLGNNARVCTIRGVV